MLILCGLTLGLVRTVFFPKTLNTYENRYANQIALPTPGSYADGSFQSSVEAALSDQLPFSQRFKRLYNLASSALTTALLNAVVEPGRYYRIGDRLLFSDYLVFSPRTPDELQDDLDARAANLNAAFAAHPETDFYVYYIERDSDLNFETGVRLHADDVLFSQLTLPAERMGTYEIPDFATFAERYYRTDHHWCYRGSYLAYCELLDLLGCGDGPLAPYATETLGQFSGSKAAATGLEGFYEPMTVYRFNFPAMDITVNGSPAADYGNQNGNPLADGYMLNYASVYGNDDGEVVFDTHRADRSNLLILGESYDNAVIKLLATHFQKTYAVDLRYYSPYMGEEFSLGDYLQKNGIDTVLLIGSIDFFNTDDFILEG